MDFAVSTLGSDGSISQRQVSLAELLRGDTIHVRDLVSLALHPSGPASTRRAPPMILPRPGCIVVALGQVKAIVRSQSVMLFDPHLTSVKSWLDSMQSCLPQDPNDQAFELFVLEAGLQELCDAFQRRMCLYRPLVDALLAGGDDLAAAEIGLHRVVLLKDALSDFELEISDLMSLLQRILDVDQDMLDLLLTAQAEAKARGEDLDKSMHDEVELMLENYHRQLELCLHDVKSMQRHVQSKQDFMAISLDVHRNRMSRMNVHLGIGAVSIGLCTTVAGYLGMNVPIPDSLTGLPQSFWVISAGSALVAASVHALCISWLGGYNLQKQAQKKYTEVMALQGILRDMHRVDFALKSAEGAPELSRDQFRRALEEVAPSRSISDLEVDLLFRSLDRSGDGVLQPAEINIAQRQRSPSQGDTGRPF